MPTTPQETRVEIDDDNDGNIDRIEFDTDGDGTPDRIAHLNADGRWERVERDADDDGNIDRINHYTFDDDGNRRVTRIEFDLDDDGTIDRSEDYNYNSNGDRTRTNFDDDADGTTDRSEDYGYFDGRLNRTRFDDDEDSTFDRAETYTYDGNGNRVQTDFDDDGDGTADRIERYTVDGDGNRSVTRIDFDLDDDGTIDRTAHLNADGRWERVERDADDDGIIDRITHHTFDDDGNRSVTRRDADLDDDGNIDRMAHLNADGRWERVERDADDDGIIDRIDHYAFDDDGNRSVTRTDFDLDDDGTIDRTAHLNADGRWERVERDADDDGIIDRINHYAFDDDGNRSVTRRDFDDDDDGNIDRTVHLNADGRWERVERDDDDDGNIDRTVHRNTDGTGTLNRTDFDDDGDGTTDRSEFYTHNVDSNRIQTEFDDDADGTTDRSETYTYDDDGRVSQTGFDDDADGTTDRTETYTYDDDGNRNRTDFDDDADGTTDRTETYTYDDDGNRNRTDFDDDADGTTDRTETYIYDANGRVSQTGFDDDTDGTTDRIETYIYDANGRVSQTGFDDDTDGTTDRTEAYTLDGSGNRTRTDFDDDADGTTDRTEAYTLDGSGNRTRTDFDDDADGMIDRAAFDTDGDGTIDRSEAYFYTNGRRTRTEFDDDADGNTDRVIVAENRIAAYRAPDAEGDSPVYSLSGTDAALFTIDADTGEVSFMAAPDFEAPGDDDRDNVYDITVTASDGTNQTDQSVAITVTDEYDLVPLSSLDGTNGFILTGTDASEQSGTSVSSAGDVNGDGYDDLIIGAWGATPDGDSNAGETYVVYGGASAPGTGGVLDLSTLDGTNGFILAGIDEDDRSGASVSSAGDVNGDGYDDLIIGAYRADPNGDSYAGETYIVYGGASAPGTGGVLDLSDLDGTNGFILAGIDGSDRSGFSVSSAGDVNGDGYDDLIIGADRADPNGDSDAGETYLVYGGASAPGTDGVLDLSTLNGTNGFILNGIDMFDHSGISVSSAGDINGDGYDDLIIGAFEADPNGDNRAGETYLVYGGASAPGTGGRFNLSALDGTNGFILTGIDAFDRSGRSVSSAGDVNGDGYDDLIIGAWGAAPGEDSSAGETYVVYGGGARAPGTGGRFNLSTLNGTNGFILTGIDADDESGFSVSSAGDINGDGYDDLIIGADGADPNGVSQAGETYLVYGGASAPGTGGVLDLSALDGSNGFTLTGIDAGDQSGRSVSSAGDVNGDGYDDLIIGARYGDPNGDSNAGETYIVYGGATGTESLVPVTASGTAAADNFTGNAGADSFTDIATNDVVRGGAGDDTISVTSLDFAAIDGGTGQDRLILDGAGLSLDLTGAGHAGVDSVEVFDLSGTGANTLVLDALAVFGLTEDRAGGVASLDVLGDADDRVDLGGSSFALTGTVTEDGTTYNVYRDGNAQLRVEDGVSVTLAATPTGSMGTGTAFGANGDGDPERIKDRDASGLSVRLDEDTDGDGDTDRVTYEGDTDFAGNFPNNIGLEVVRLDGLDGEGGTDLTIPDEFVFAGNGEPARPVRIEGGNTDTLRFDMDDFAEAPEPVGFGGESYRGFASDDQTWSFLVDADVMLFDI